MKHPLDTTLTNLPWTRKIVQNCQIAKIGNSIRSKLAFSPNAKTNNMWKVILKPKFRLTGRANVKVCFWARINGAFWSRDSALASDLVGAPKCCSEKCIVLA